MYYVSSVKGVKIAVYDYNPEGGETIFLVHGWPLSSQMYEYQLKELICRGYRVIAIDLRGFGRSDVPACGYSYDEMAEDIYHVVSALKLCSFTLVGFSMGGAITLRYMRKYRGYEVKKLILLAAAAPSWTQRPGFPYGLTRQYVDSLIALAQTDRPKLSKNFSEQLFYRPHSEAAVDWFKQIALSASGMGTVQSAIALRDEDGREDLCWVKAPTRIIYGERDTVVTKELIQAQYQGISGAKLYTLQNSGHGIIYDELELFNKTFMEAVAC